MKNYPLIYVIILNWNGKKFLEECINSIQTNDYANFRIVIVDNASSDGSVQFLQSNFPDITCIQNKENLRFAEGNNVGIRYALQNKADYVLLLNNDTKSHKNLLWELTKATQSDTQIGMVAPKIYYYDNPNLIWFAGGEINLWKGIVKHIGIRQKDDSQFDDPRKVDYLTACAILVKREVVEKVGMLDPAYYIYAEDADWCLRAQKHGYICYYEPRAKLWHKISASSGQISFFKIKHRLASHFRLMWRYAPKIALFTTIPFFFILDMIRIIVLITTNQLKK